MVLQIILLTIFGMLFISSLIALFYLIVAMHKSRKKEIELARKFDKVNTEILKKVLTSYNK